MPAFEKEESSLEIERPYRRLRVYNLIMGFLHFAQGLTILLISNSTALPINTSFLSVQNGRLAPVIEKLVDVPLGPMIAVFLFLSSLAHFVISTMAFKWYVANLKRGANYARWYEYSLSASVMIVLIAMLCGIYDLGALIMAFVLTAVMNLCGLLMEMYNQNRERVSWAAFNIGSLAGVAPWVAIAIYFFGSLSTAEGGVPTFVYIILPTLFVFFFSFALNMWLQYKKVGPWRDYIFGERMYVLLSLLAKSALAWQVFAGTLRPV
jgi:hypothetical protein